MNKQVILIVLDGWGYREDKTNNAIHEAKTPFFDRLWHQYPHSLLQASGLSVGLPEGQMGNSEVGHTTIGAGKIIDTDLVRISRAALNDEFSHNPVFNNLFSHIKKYDSILHVMGLIGPGGIHSHSDHLFEFLKTAKKSGIKKIAVHAFTDGRDTPPQSADNYLKELEDILEELKIGLIATLSGRYYAMDRDKNWDRLEFATKALFESKGNISPYKPSQSLKNIYKSGIGDEHVEPIVFLDDKGRSYPISKNDGVFFFNFRADRAKQLSEKIAQRAYNENIFFVTMTQYDPSIDSKIAFPPCIIETTLAKEISCAGLDQVHIAETEKFAHATYFLNGGQKDLHQKETHILIDSRKDVATHDQAPEMKAREIADKSLEYIASKTPFIFVNFANPDMVGHTAKKAGIISALESVDHQLERLISTAQSHRAIALITADHGNVEINVDENGHPHTAHTLSPVPAILIGHDKKLKDGTLADVAPTILEILNLPKPESMTGTSLLV